MPLADRRRRMEENRERSRISRREPRPSSTFKAAINSSDTILENYLGSLDSVCSNCSARHFSSERTGRDVNLFSQCCEKGKFILPPFQPSSLIQSLLDGTHQHSKNYKSNIRQFNSSLAMISTGIQSEVVQGGPFYMRIHGSIYHTISTLHPPSGSAPQYAQLYIYDADEAARHRIQNPANAPCNQDLMTILSQYIRDINPFAQSFKSMHRAIENNPQSCQNIRMRIFKDKETDPRRYNPPTSADVAAIFQSTDGGPPGDRHLVVRPYGGGLENVSHLSQSMDPLAYPLLFPFGESGWHPGMQQTSPRTASRTKITHNNYAAYRIAVRNNFSILHRSEKLFLQWLVDIYVRIEGDRLNYIRHNQSDLRRDLYLNLADYVQNRAQEQNLPVGHMVILPSSFTGSPRNMNERYQDAMCIVRHYGKPDLFITFTCNPKWTEIKEQLAQGEYAHYRPDIVARVFHSKLKSLIDDVMKKRIFGKVAALIYTIEFQKRGLPHAHILISLDSDDKVQEIEQVDSYVSAEIPNESDPLYEIVKSHMMHGPCGILSSSARQSPCMDDQGNCKKQFPKKFNNQTHEHANGYAVYRRRDTGNLIHKGSVTLDNRWVVPYNRYLLFKYNAHINVEICSTVKSVKYIYKYIYKGYDACTVSIRNEASYNFDEINSFVDARYVGSSEAAWRVLEYELHYQSSTVYKLNCHLENEQTVTFGIGTEASVVANPRRTNLTAWFQLNQVDESARNFLYTEIPQHYRWDNGQTRWIKRRRSGDRVITRLYTVNPKRAELFYLRLLLLHVKGAQGFEDLRTHDGVVHPTFNAAAIARGLAESDQQWKEAMHEASESKSPHQIRDLFACIVGLNAPSDVIGLWNQFKDSMIEDFLLTSSEAESINKALLQIDALLITHNTSCEKVGLPIPTPSLSDITIESLENFAQIFEEKYSNATADQKIIITSVLSALNSSDDNISKVFYCDAPAGCGKTYVQETIRAFMLSQGRRCIAVCYTGIAASLIKGARTMHNTFKLPVPLLETSVPNITAQSAQGQILRNCELIIIDEASMVPKLAFTIIDRLLRDLTRVNLPFGGKVLFMSGDFRQTLPVKPHGGRSATVEMCIKNTQLWHQVRHFQLSRNMRVNAGEEEFARYLLEIGNGTIQPPIDHSYPYQSLLDSRLRGSGSVIDFVFPNIDNLISSDMIIDRAILAPKNEDCAKINKEVLSRLPGEEHTYFSIDRIVSDESIDHVNFPTEYLNSIEVSGIPRHKLHLKVNSVVILLRNLNTARGLINGTRMQVKELNHHFIECKILTGASRGENVLIPRIKLSPSPEILPFTFFRLQFPLSLAFAMTINKSQGQSLSRVGIFLPRPVFSHGQLYVAISRCRSFDGVKIFFDNSHHDNTEQYTLPSGDIVTKNVVYTEVLRMTL